MKKMNVDEGKLYEWKRWEVRHKWRRWEKNEIEGYMYINKNDKYGWIRWMQGDEDE